MVSLAHIYCKDEAIQLARAVRGLILLAVLLAPCACQRAASQPEEPTDRTARQTTHPARPSNDGETAVSGEGGVSGEPGASADPRHPVKLGDFPLCEASAALRAPWDPSLVLVADNEVQGQLFGFQIGADGLLKGMTSISLPAKHRPRDIEALSALPDGQLLVVGSHSRNKDCQVKKKRRRLRALEWTGEQLEEVAFVDSNQSWTFDDPDGCMRLHFQGEPPGAESLCGVLGEAEHAAKLAQEEDEPLSEDRCQTLNIEGAALVPVSAGADAAGVWLGLRRPLVDHKAVLLRLVWPAATLRFDRMVLVDLDDNGIRELAVDEDTLWIVGGSTADSDLPHRLWTLPLAALGADARGREATSEGPVPTSAEGLVLDGGTPILVIDGAEGDEACEEPARQFRRE